MRRPMRRLEQEGDLLDLRFARNVKLGLTGPLIDAQDVGLPGFASARDESRDDSDETTQNCAGAKSCESRSTRAGDSGAPKWPANLDQVSVFPPSLAANSTDLGAGWMHRGIEGD